MSKIVITESEKNKILNLYGILNEQGFIEFAAHETTTGSGWDQGIDSTGKSTLKTLPSKDVVKNLFILSRSWSSSQNDINKVKPIMLKMKNEMKGLGAGNFLKLLSQIKTTGELSTLNNNWKKFTGESKTLFQWLSEEYTISWDQILNILDKSFRKYIVRKVGNMSTTT